MQIEYQEIWDEIVAFLVKYVSIPALIALFIKIAVQVKKKQATIIGVAVSLFVGLGTAYLTKDFVGEHFTSEGNRTLVIAFIAIMADKVAEYLIFKSNVDKFFDMIGSEITKKVKSWFGK